MGHQIKMASAVVKSGEHVRSEKLESISGASMPRLAVSSAEVICEYNNKKKTEFLII